MRKALAKTKKELAGTLLPAPVRTRGGGRSSGESRPGD